MGVKFVCGMVEVGEGAEPDWGEVAARLRLLQQLEKETAHFKFMGAVQDDYGAWRVPFLAALKAPCRPVLIWQRTRIRPGFPSQGCSSPCPSMPAVFL